MHFYFNIKYSKIYKNKISKEIKDLLKNFSSISVSRTFLKFYL